MKQCPYNAKHIHPSVEHQYHLQQCPDRMFIDKDILQGMNSQILANAESALPVATITVSICRQICLLLWRMKRNYL